MHGKSQLPGHILCIYRENQVEQIRGIKEDLEREKLLMLSNNFVLYLKKEIGQNSAK